jgi:hypothetical protein
VPIEMRPWITRAMLRAEREKLFVFGDNLARVGFGGQAKEMRGEPNAVGLPTKRSPHEFLQDRDLDEIRSVVAPDLMRLQNHLLVGKTIVWPADGIGTGRAALHHHAHDIHEWYGDLLAALQLLASSVDG